jgi:hypothetical protein
MAALVLLALVLAEGSFLLTRGLRDELDACRRELADIAEAAPRLELVEPEKWNHDLQKVCRLPVKNVGGAATFWAHLTVVQPRSTEQWTAEWGRGNNLLGEARAHLAKGETKRIALARVEPIGVQGTRVAILAIEAGRRLYAWSGDDSEGPLLQCVVEIEIFSEPAMLSPFKARYMIDHYNFMRVDI